MTQFTNDFCVTCEVTFNDFKFIFISIYMHPTSKIETALNFLSEIILEFSDRRIIIQSDTNARHPTWDHDDSNSRGELLFDFILENGLIVTNEDSISTFYTRRDEVIFKSVVDLSICNRKAYRLHILFRPPLPSYSA